LTFNVSLIVNLDLLSLYVKRFTADLVKIYLTYYCLCGFIFQSTVSIYYWKLAAHYLFNSYFSKTRSADPN